MKHPVVTIVITCYNYAEYVAIAIESALNQTYAHTDVIVIDDGSTDSSLEVINQYAGRVRVVSRTNKGIVYTRNEALKIAEGDYLCFLDADDIFDTDYIEKMVAIAQKHKADVVYPDWHVFGDRKYTMKFPEFDTQALIRQEIHCTAESLIRLAAVEGYRFDSEKVAEDWDFFLGLALAGKKFVHAEGCYINYRVRKNTRGSSRSYWEDMREFCLILEKWQRKYPALVNPVDLPIAVGERRDEFIAEQSEIIQQRSRQIKKLEHLVDDRKVYLDDLHRELELVRNSRAYRIGRCLLAPLRIFTAKDK